MCDAGCVQVEKFIIETSEKNNTHRNNIINRYHTNLMSYKSYRVVNSGNYGHMNYTIISYAVQHNHITCLKELHKIGAMWHADLACVALENNNIECFKYIMENMGDVSCGMELLKIIKKNKKYKSSESEELENYITAKCWNCLDDKLHPKISK